MILLGNDDQIILPANFGVVTGLLLTSDVLQIPIQIPNLVDHSMIEVVVLNSGQVRVSLAPCFRRRRRT